MKEYHHIQIAILGKLLFAKRLNYAKLKPVDMENSQFTFHLGQLIAAGLVQKDGVGIYALTLSGKNFANTIDFQNETSGHQAKLSVVLCCKRGDEILVYKRLKNPFYGCEGFPTGKVQYGESIVEAAQRSLKTETNLEGDASLVGIRHYRIYGQVQQELLEDKVMYVYLIDRPKGELSGNSIEEFRWINVGQKLDNPLIEYLEILRMVLEFDHRITFKEISHYVNSF